jgi:hypothetical protein
MAKGDADKAQNQIDYQGKTQQQNLSNLQSSNQGLQQGFQNFYNQTAPMNLGNYNQNNQAYDQFLQGMPNQGNLYSTFLGSRYGGATGQNQGGQTSSGDPVDQLLAKYGAQDTGPGSGITDASYWKQKYQSTGDPYYLNRLEDDLKGNGMDTGGGGSYGGGMQAPNRSAAIDQAISTYGNFANTGGFSPEDIANIRARSVAPIRSMAQTNTDEINRQNAIRGTAYSPNTAAAIAKVARDANYAAGDTATNAEANLAQLVQQGKLYGAGGLASTGLADQGNVTQNRLADLANATQNRGLDLSAIGQSGQQQLGALQGKTNLYGTTPGLTNMFGNQTLGASGQGIQIGGLQNQMANDIMNAQLNKAKIPGDFQSAMGNIASLFNLGGASINPLSKLFSLFGGGGLSSTDPTGGYISTLPGDPSGGTGIGPGMIGYYGGGGMSNNPTQE